MIFNVVGLLLDLSVFPDLNDFNIEMLKSSYSHVVILKLGQSIDHKYFIKLNYETQ